MDKSMITMPLEASDSLLGRAAALREHYRASLFDDVIAWWIRHSLDREFGGYYSHLNRDGSTYSTDKYMWMNGRQVWMLSHLFNAHEPREEWRDAAKLGMDFMLRHAWKEGGKMHFRLTRTGESRSDVLSLFTEVFGTIALAEYSRVAGDDDALWNRAMEAYDFLMSRLGLPDNTPLLSYPLNTQVHLHGHDMCRITVAWVYNQIRPDARFENDITRSVESLVGLHWKPELGALLESVAPDGTPLLDIAECRMFHPGHTIESGWMLQEIAAVRNDAALRDTAIAMTLAALEHGWDNEFGGIRYITNIDWTPVHDLGADLKLWWVHSEALYSLLLGWALTGREELGRWYDKVHDYTFSRFPDPEYGEWYGYLNRDGSPVWQAKANGWKGCFHSPRVLYRCFRLLRNLGGSEA